MTAPAECTEKEAKFIEKMKAKSAEDVSKQLTRLQGMLSKPMKVLLLLPDQLYPLPPPSLFFPSLPSRHRHRYLFQAELKAWVSQRVNILSQLASAGKTEL